MLNMSVDFALRGGEVLSLATRSPLGGPRWRRIGISMRTRRSLTFCQSPRMRSAVTFGLVALGGCHTPAAPVAQDAEVRDVEAPHDLVSDAAPIPNTDAQNDAATWFDAATMRDAGAADALDAAAPVARPTDGQPSFCQRAGDDAIRDLFCGAAPPRDTEVCATSKIRSESVRCCVRTNGCRRHGTTQARQPAPPRQLHRARWSTWPCSWGTRPRCPDDWCRRSTRASSWARHPRWRFSAACSRSSW